MAPPSRPKSTSRPIRSTTTGQYKVIDRIKESVEGQPSHSDFVPLKPITTTKSPNPTWTYGAGITSSASTGATSHVEVDPYAPDRPVNSNYKLLTSGIAPRPIGLLSTISKDGKKNLAPFSYFQVVDHDPPLFIVGFSASSGRAKDTFKNLVDTGECVINTVSEDMIEAVVATCIDAPEGVSEWDISGLNETSSSTVKPPRVRESVFSIEGELVDVKELGVPDQGRSVAATALIRASRFWVRGNATNDEVTHIDIEKLRPVAQLGGMAYARVSETFDVTRRKWKDEIGSSAFLQQLQAEQAQTSERDDVKGTNEEGQGFRATSGRA